MRMKQVLKNRECQVGGLLVLGYLVWGFIWFIQSRFIKGSVSGPYTPVQDIKTELLEPFSANFILGTDIYGRSLMETMSAGLFYSLSTAVIVTFLSASIGLFIGYFSVTSGATVRYLSNLLTNIIFIFPSLLIAIILMAFIGESHLGLILTLTLTSWAGYARVIRGETMRVMGLSFVEADKAMGMTPLRMLRKSIVPAIFPQVSIHLVLGLSGVIMSEATLGFLGLGGSDYSWGNLLNMSKDVLLEAPHLTIILSTVLGGLIISLNLFGDGLRDVLDFSVPKSDD